MAFEDHLSKCATRWRKLDIKSSLKMPNLAYLVALLKWLPSDLAVALLWAQILTAILALEA